MRLLINTVAAILVMSFSPVATLAADEAPRSAEPGLQSNLYDVGAQFRSHAQAIMDDYRNLDETNRQLKAAGASYQKSLTADPASVSNYTTTKQQSTMSGVYLCDASYAALFLKKKEMADSLEAQKALNDRIGFGMALTPRMKKLLENPDSIRDYETWVEAADESMKNMVVNGLLTDERVVSMADIMYGATIEGLYVNTESVAQSGYTPEMLALLKQQRDRVQMIMEAFDVFRNDEAFKEKVQFDRRIKVLDSIHKLLITEKFAQGEVDRVRTIVTPEREAIIKGQI